MTYEEYAAFCAATKERRIEWFRNARFGMFIHYGLFSLPRNGRMGAGMGKYQNLRL